MDYSQKISFFYRIKCLRLDFLLDHLNKKIKKCNFYKFILTIESTLQLNLNKIEMINLYKSILTLGSVIELNENKMKKHYFHKLIFTVESVIRVNLNKIIMI
jgi:hypothetical protein